MPSNPWTQPAFPVQSGIRLAAALAESAAAPDAELQRIETWHGGPWTLRWCAAEEELRVMLAESAKGQAAVVVNLGERESDPAERWRRALTLGAGRLHYAPWPYGRLASCACVLRPTVEYVRRIDALRQGRLRLVDAVRTLSVDQPVICLGHGASGALAGALAPWLESQSPIRSRRSLQWLSYGAPAIGNQAFADGLAQHYGAEYGRVYNRLDPVTYLWGGVGWLLRSFVGAGSAPRWLQRRVMVLEEELRRDGIHCRQPEAGYGLQGQLMAVDDWFEQARLQHQLSTYQQLLEAREYRVMEGS